MSDFLWLVAGIWIVVILVAIADYVRNRLSKDQGR